MKRKIEEKKVHAVLGKYNNNKKKLKTNYEKGQLQNEKNKPERKKKEGAV